MILQRFEVENWSCIRHAVIDNLPESGVVVLHGPNRTGKSSLVAALRATLFDFPATSAKAELRRYFPDWTTDAPRVTVEFQADGGRYRVLKEFKKSGGSCSLERFAPGGWSTITRTPAEVHDQTLALAGAKGSERGLPQLLWLRQTDIHLPEKGIDDELQGRLRSILGVMQTPLDDALLAKIKTRWLNWHTPKSRPGQTPNRPKSCELVKDLERLAEFQAERSRLDDQFRAIEAWLARAEYLETDSVNLQTELRRRDAEVQQREVREREVRARLEAFRLAKMAAEAADREVLSSRKRLDDREDAQRLRDQAHLRLKAASNRAEQAEAARDAAQDQLAHLDARLDTARIQMSAVQLVLKRVDEQERLDQQRSLLTQKRTQRDQADHLQQELESLRKLDREQPAPTRELLQTLVANRDQAQRQQAQIDAAAMALLLKPAPEAPPATLVLDGEAPTLINHAGRWAARRHLSLTLPGWGTIEIARGTDSRQLEDIEREVDRLDREFRSQIAPFGLSGDESDALDRLRAAFTDHSGRAVTRDRLLREQKALGVADLDKIVQECERLEAAILVAHERLANLPAPTDPSTNPTSLRSRLADGDAEITSLNKSRAQAIRELEGTPDGLRARAGAARNAQSEAKGAAQALQQALENHPSLADLTSSRDAAIIAHDQALETLKSTQPTDEELGLPDQLAQARDSLRQGQERYAAIQEELHRLQGSLSGSAGLHQQRAEAEAAVAALLHETERETLEAAAFDRLHALFEDCRQKQMGAVVAPMTDRVQRWMRLLGLADYQALECGDQFLPHGLIRKGRGEVFPLDQESTGTQEQLTLMVRLALGSLLSTGREAAVAVLDDPLTHSDPRRLEGMRAVLKTAAAGDPSTTPPAGPLQILVFTCRPDWFPAEAGRMIDLGDPAILVRA